MDWIRTKDAHRLATEKYEVVITRLSAEECAKRGYAQCAEGWSMDFVRGGLRSYAFHESAGAAECNAERIMGYLEGTRDIFGLTAGSEGST